MSTIQDIESIDGGNAVMNYFPTDSIDVPRRINELDSEDRADLWDERAALVGETRDAAFESGMAAYDPAGDRDAAAATISHLTLRQDFCAGWDTAALDEAVARQFEGAI